MHKRFDHLKKDFVQGFPAFCGFEVDLVGPGQFETRLNVRPEHTQQDNFVHAGVIATMADHTAGYAAYTTVSDQFRILTIEFKINFLKPAIGDTLICKSKVLKEGRTIIIAESEIFSGKRDHTQMIAKSMVTLMAVPIEKVKQQPQQ